MQIQDTSLPGVKLLQVRYLEDERGYFVETFSARTFAAAGLPHGFVQDNQSLSRRPGTLRGMHWQAPPFAQAKLVRVTRGAVLDVVVDIRPDSPTYRQHLAVELSARNRLQLLVPTGFAHGFLTLEPDCEVTYKVDALYDARSERGLNWADPDLALPWPSTPAVSVVSAKDQAWPRLREIEAALAA